MNLLDWSSRKNQANIIICRFCILSVIGMFDKSLRSVQFSKCISCMIFWLVKSIIQSDFDIISVQQISCFERVLVSPAAMTSCENCSRVDDCCAAADLRQKSMPTPGQISSKAATDYARLLNTKMTGALSKSIRKSYKFHPYNLNLRFFFENFNNVNLIASDHCCCLKFSYNG